MLRTETGRGGSGWVAYNADSVFRPGRNASRMMAVPIETSPTLRIGTPRMLFESNFIPEDDGSGLNNYDVGPDGRFLMIQSKAAAAGSELPRPQINVVVNWFDELKRLVPVN